MKRESFSAVEHTAALSAGILQAWRRLTADRSDQVVRIANDSHGLGLLLDVLDLDLLLRLLLSCLSCLLRGLLLSRLLLGCGLLLSCLLLRLSLRLSLSLRLLLLNHCSGFVRHDGSIWSVWIESAVDHSVVAVELSL